MNFPPSVRQIFTVVSQLLVKAQYCWCGGHLYCCTYEVKFSVSADYCTPHSVVFFFLYRNVWIVSSLCSLVMDKSSSSSSAPTIQEILPKSGIVYSEKGNLTEVRKSFNLILTRGNIIRARSTPLNDVSRCQRPCSPFHAHFIATIRSCRYYASLKLCPSNRSLWKSWRNSIGSCERAFPHTTSTGRTLSSIKSSRPERTLLLNSHGQGRFLET